MKFWKNIWIVPPLQNIKLIMWYLFHYDNRKATGIRILDFFEAKTLDLSYISRKTG